MNILQRTLGRISGKSYNPAQAPTTKEERIFWTNGFGFGTSEWRGVSAALRAGNVVASGMGSMPIEVDSPELSKLLNDTPNELQTGPELVEQLTMHAKFSGAGRAYIERRRGKAVAIYPLIPNWTAGEWKWDAGAEEYVLPVHIDRGENRNEYIGDFSRDNILEITSPRWEMTRSLSVTQSCQNVLGLSRSLQERQARLSDTNAPYGILVAKDGTSQAAIDKLKTAWAAQFGKSGIAVVDFDAGFTQLMQNASDQQLLETMQFQIEEVARMYGVHPYMLMKTAGSGAQSAISDIMLFHQVYTMGPWISRWESALKRTVTKGKAVNFDESALLRTTPSAKAEIHARALGAGGNRPWMTQNDVRREWGMGAEEGGDDLNPPAPVGQGLDLAPIEEAAKQMAGVASEIKALFDE